jgi:predicted dehydrogenase
MSDVVRLAVVGAGLIGQRHARLIRQLPGVCLCAVVDPAAAGQAVALSLDADWFADMQQMLDEVRPDGVVIATPNQMHVEHGLAAVAAGVPALVEKPIADSVAAAEQLVQAAEAAGVPLLVGHHRRHNPLIQRAKAVIESGRLGRMVTVHGFFWLYKPEDYFDTAWRRQTGAGPILINLIHDLDLLRYLCGEIVSVQAMASNAVRGFAVEDTAAAILRFGNGAIGTISASDTVVGPWSWEQTSGENPAYPRTDQPCYMIGGTHGSLSLPHGEVWRNADARSWWEPLQVSRTHSPDSDPLLLQIDHFRAVIRDGAEPLVSGREGLRTLQVVEALTQSATEGVAVSTAL